MNRNIRLEQWVREYAKKARSTRSSMMVEGPHNEVLKHAGDGREVDIYDLNRACMAALASCATRGSTSAERRILAGEIMLLANYIVDELAGRETRPREKARQPIEFAPDELEDWLRV